MLRGLQALALGVSAWNAWSASQQQTVIGQVANAVATVLPATATMAIEYLLRNTEIPSEVAPVLQQGAQQVLHREALDRPVSLSALTEAQIVDPVTLEPFALGERVVVLRGLNDRGAILPSQILKEQTWRDAIASGYVLNPTTRQPVTESYVTVVGAGMPKGNKKAGFVGLMLAKKHLGMKPQDYEPPATTKRTPAKFVSSKIEKPSAYIQNAFPVKQRGRPKKEVVALAPTGRFSKAQRDELKARAAQGDEQARATLEELRRVERERKKKVKGGALRIEPGGAGGGVVVVDEATGQVVASFGTQAEAEAYIRSRTPPREQRVVQPPDQKKAYEEAKKREAVARRKAAAAARRQQRNARAMEARRIRTAMENGTATDAEVGWYENYMQNQSTSGSE